MQTTKTAMRAIAAALALASLPRGAAANSGITVETVNDYTWWVPDGSKNTICNTEGNYFWNEMTASGTGWTQLVHYVDNSVFDTDFYDPQRPGSLAQDNDTNNFDRAGNAISFVCVHGSCDDCTTTSCSTGGNCPAGQECMANPPSAYSSRCANLSPRRLVTSSSSNWHGNLVFYGDGRVKWGEDSASGSWAGAGTNGGTNVVFLVNSCGLRPYFWAQQSPAFAGAHLIASIMPVSNVAKGSSGLSGCADAWNYDYRGFFLAAYALANPNSSITSGWFSNLDVTPQAVGTSCPDLTTNYTYGGGHGIGGCGAYNVLSFDVTQSLANWHVDSESWLGARFEWNDATGNAYGRWAAHCNYDCYTYPFTK